MLCVCWRLWVHLSQCQSSFLRKQYLPNKADAYFNSLHAGYFFMIFLPSDFLQNLLFLKILSGILSVTQIVWVQIRTNILLVLTGFKLLICINTCLQTSSFFNKADA